MYDGQERFLRSSRSSQPLFLSTSHDHDDDDDNDDYDSKSPLFTLPTTPPRLQNDIPDMTTTTTTLMTVTALALLGAPEAALAATTSTAAGPLPQALLAWLHFVGLMGVAGGLVTERFLLQPGLTVQQEQRVNTADGIYGLSALTLLVTGYFRVTQYAKGWDFYKNEPIFWIKMASVAILGALSVLPAIVLFRRDQARRAGMELAPLSDALVERMTRIVNAELLAVLSIPLLASLMARGVGYIQDFPWAIGVVLYVVCLGGAGYKYGKEAFTLMEQEGALIPLNEMEKKP